MSTHAQSVISSAFADASLGTVAHVSAPLTVEKALFEASRARSDAAEKLRTEGPWVALCALAALIVLFSVIGIVVICFTWSR